MEELEQLNEELNRMMARTEELLGKEEAKKEFEKNNIPEEEEIETSQELN